MIMSAAVSDCCCAPRPERHARAAAYPECATLGIPIEPAALDELLSAPRKKRACNSYSFWIYCWEHRPMPAPNAGWRAVFEKRTAKVRNVVKSNPSPTRGVSVSR
jgi:hypothetical protein